MCVVTIPIHLFVYLLYIYTHIYIHISREVGEYLFWGAMGAKCCYAPFYLADSGSPVLSNPEVIGFYRGPSKTHPQNQGLLRSCKSC